MFQKELNYFLYYVLVPSFRLLGSRAIKRSRLAYSIGYDITEENKLQQTLELVKVQAASNLHSKMKYIQQTGIT